jgi:hypothetical protein
MEMEGLGSLKKINDNLNRIRCIQYDAMYQLSAQFIPLWGRDLPAAAYPDV